MFAAPIYHRLYPRWMFEIHIESTTLVILNSHQYFGQYALFFPPVLKKKASVKGSSILPLIITFSPARLLRCLLGGREHGRPDSLVIFKKGRNSETGKQALLFS